MLIASLLMVGTGTFCIANANLSFLSVAIVVGIALLVMGIAEFLVGMTCKINAHERVRSSIIVNALLAFILGIVFSSGQINEEQSVISIFALWTIMNGFNSISLTRMNYKINTTVENVSQLLGILTALIGIYSFFNSTLLNVSVLILVGLCMMLKGLDCFKLSLQIEYRKSELISSAEEKLEEAKIDEKEAMEKAKNAIKDSKEAKNRIAKYTMEIAKEEALKNKLTKSRRKGNKG